MTGQPLEQVMAAVKQAAGPKLVGSNRRFHRLAMKSRERHRRRNDE